MKNISFFFLITIVFVSAQPWKEHGKIIVNPNSPHYLSYSDGSEFFYLGDTAWLLFQRLTRDEADLYLKDRAEKEFNVIQAVALIEFDGLTTPNAYGDLPFYNKNLDKLNITEGNSPANELDYDYWDHLDFVIKKAEEYGLYIGLLPCWGEYVIPRVSKPFFNSRKETYDYGNFIGKRFAHQPNIIWILGGDREPDERDIGIKLWRAMAEGIADGVNGVSNFDEMADYTTTLITYHCYNSSSNWFHNDDWIDFHTYGSYHSNFNDERSYKLAEKDWNLSDPKPTLNSEPAYEGHTINWIKDNGLFKAYDVRQIAYWSVFAGAAGHTYGAHPVWQFYDENREKITFVNNKWPDALNFEGASQIKYLRRLMESRPFSGAFPDQSLISDEITNNYNHVRVLRTYEYAYVYLPTGIPTNIKLGRLNGYKIKAQWYNPRNGELSFIGIFENKGIKLFDPPGMSDELSWLQTGRGCDWILILESE